MTMKNRDISDCYNLDRAVVDLWKRQIGQISSRTFASRLGASEDLVLRLDCHRKLENRAWTTTVGFSSDGSMVVSGDLEGRVVLWDWQHGHVKLSFHTGHNIVSQAKFMPFANERSMVICGTEGQVRHAMILESGHVDAKLLAKHEGPANNLATEHGSPYIFYSCGQDGVVQHFDLRTGAATKLFTCQSRPHNFRFPILELNAIAIDPRRPSLFAVAGGDEYTRIYDFRKYKQDGSSSFDQPTGYLCPQHLIGNDIVQVTGLAFSDQSELLASYKYDFIYLFSKDSGLGTISNLDSSNDFPQIYNERINFLTTMGANFLGPRCDYIVSGSDCGQIFIWRKKNGALLRVLEKDDNQMVVNCVQPHPHTTVLASCGDWSGDIKLWLPKASERVELEKIDDDGCNGDGGDDDEDIDGDKGDDNSLELDNDEDEF